MSSAVQAAAAETATKRIDEGSCHMCFDSGEETTVFYNPVQVQNRDLSVLMIARYAERRKQEFVAKQEKIRLRKQAQDPNGTQDTPPNNNDFPGLDILDALAASGLRSMRYWKECTPAMIHHITVNDLDPAAHVRATRNITSNDLPVATDRSTAGLRIQTADATHVMYNSRQKRQRGASDDNTEAMQWDVIDLDPYGSAAPFLDGAVQAVVSGGLLNITCTDMAALGGSHPETCFGRYLGAMPISRASYLQELAVRMLLYSVAMTAARYGRVIEPVLSVGMDFYVRVFVIVKDSKAGVNQLSLRTGQLYQSSQSPSFHVVPVGQLGGKKGTVYQPARLNIGGACAQTGSPFKIAGPLWIGPLHNSEFVRDGLEALNSSDGALFPSITTKGRLSGLLTSCLDELNDVPLYYKLPDLSRAVQTSSMPLMEMKSAVVHAGYRVSGYHKDPDAIKTDAPDEVVWDIMRAWVKKQGRNQKIQDDSAAGRILAKESTIEVDFSVAPSVRESQANLNKVSRFPMNPEANWGPKARATGVKRTATGTPKSAATHGE